MEGPGQWVVAAEGDIAVTPIVDSEPLAIVSREPLLESGLGVFFKRALNKAVFIFVLFRPDALDYRYASG